MQIDTDDLVPSSELTRNTALYVRQAAEGRRFVIINNSVPKAALVSIEDLKRLAELDDSPKINTAQANVSTYLAALGIDDIDTYDFASAWAEKPLQFVDRVALTAPLGVTDTGVYTVDLAETRGIVLSGSTGSGKSNVLMTLVLAMCAQNSPRRLQILHVSFTEGAGPAWRPIENGLPHVDFLVCPRLKGLPKVGDNDGGFTRTVVAHINELIDHRAALENRMGVPHLLVVFDEYPSGNEELDELVKRLLTTGATLKMRLVLSTQLLRSDAPETFSETARIALRQNEPQHARAVIGDEPYPPLKKGEAAAVSNRRPGVSRLRLFDPLPQLGESVPDDWMELLGARIRIAAANEEAGAVAAAHPYEAVALPGPPATALLEPESGD